MKLVYGLFIFALIIKHLNCWRKAPVVLNTDMLEINVVGSNFELMPFAFRYVVVMISCFPLTFIVPGPLSKSKQLVICCSCPEESRV